MYYISLDSFFLSIALDFNFLLNFKIKELLNVLQAVKEMFSDLAFSVECTIYRFLNT